MGVHGVLPFLRQGTGICLVGVLCYNWTKAQQPSPRPLASWPLLKPYALIIKHPTASFCRDPFDDFALEVKNLWL
jgi:hypothetical protein